MSIHGYGANALLAHYLRALTGCVIAFSVVLFAGLSSAMLWIAGPIGLLFLVFGIATALRHATKVEVSADGIRTVGPWRREILWEDLSKVDLRYYSTKKDRSDGWMQLTIRGKGPRISIESTIDEFERVVSAVATAAAARGVVWSVASVANLKALGIVPRSAEAGR